MCDLPAALLHVDRPLKTEWNNTVGPIGNQEYAQR
jgi:hypothetical protein